jgi:hypothetical protein
MVNDTRSAAPDQVPVRDPILVDEIEASRLCGVSRPTFRKWADEGRVTRIPLPANLRRNLYRLADLEAFVDALAGGPMTHKA